MLNIVTGEHGTSAVNVYDAVRIEIEQMDEFSRKLPDGFHNTIHKKVISMVVTKNHVSVGDAKVYDTNVIYSRVIGLQASAHDVNIKHVLSNELTPFPTSLFDSAGEMRVATSKSALKIRIKKTASG